MKDQSAEEQDSKEQNAKEQGSKEQRATEQSAADAGRITQTAQTEQAADVEGLAALMGKLAEGQRAKLGRQQSANSLSDADRRKHLKVIRFLEECQKALYEEPGFETVKGKYDICVNDLRNMTAKTQSELAALFVFVEEAFTEGSEMLVLVTQLTVDSASARFIASFGSEDYKKHSAALMLGERSDDIKAQIGELGL